jgi:hypothetical protein
MSRTLESPAIPVPLRPKLQMCAAMARERIAEVHFRYAMELVEHTREQIEPGRALTIYNRLHGLRGAEAGGLQHRVYVALGRRILPRSAATEAAAPETEWESPRSIVALIRRRLRGRVNRELREWVEYHTGRAETELLWAHVENALQFVELLESEVGIGNAVDVYAAELALPAPKAETVYYLSLAHRGAGNPADEVADTERGEPPAAIAEAGHRSLRIVAGRRASGRRQAG